MLWQKYLMCRLYLPRRHRQRILQGMYIRTQVESFTHGRVYDIIVSREFLGKGDKVLLIDDFLANGKALEGLGRTGYKSQEPSWSELVL